MASGTIVIRNGTLIDGSGAAPQKNDALVIEGNRIRSIGALPPELRLEDERIAVIDAAGKWIMPGLIDAHVHLSYGYPKLPGEGMGRGNLRPELNTLKAARGAQTALRAGVTSIAVPGGTYFIDVGVRDAIRLGVIEGPRIHCAGRMIIAYGCIEDDEPSWVGTPEHGVGFMCNTAAEMVTRCGARTSTASTSSRWRIAARARRKCWRARRSPRWSAKRIAASSASPSIRAAPARRAPPPRRASTGSSMPISRPRPISKPWPRPAF
ncbi:MAG: amidohydrolase family protein, partial [Stellaceae bacterium]